MRRFVSAVLVACTLGGAARPAAADELEPADAPRGRARDAMHEYFAGELAEGWVFGGFGLAGVGAGVTGLLAKDDLYRGAAFPLIGVGVIQLGAAFVLFMRTGDQVAERDDLLTRAPHTLLALERPRVERVRREFVWLRVIELSLAAGSGGLAAYGGASGNHLVAGIGTGLAVESALMLAFDGRAADRLDVYTAALDAYARAAAGLPR